ncbi:unnamed protein product, partial [Dibothriocephalus latus]
MGKVGHVVELGAIDGDACGVVVNTRRRLVYDHCVATLYSNKCQSHISGFRVGQRVRAGRVKVGTCLAS